MKKILKVLFIFVLGLIFLPNVNANSNSISIVGNNTFEDEISLFIQANDISEFDGVCDGLCGLVGKLDFDDNKIELISISPLEGFDLTQGKSLVLYKATGVSSGIKILEMKFKNKSLEKDEDISISLTDIVASDGDKDINIADISKTIKFIEKQNENSNSNNKNYSQKNEIVSKSNNNYLSKITLSNGSIKFDKEILTYDVIVGYKTNVIDVNAVAEDEKATIIGNGKHSLKVGTNVIKITVKAEDESERIYILNVNREEKNVIVEDENNNDVKKENNYIVPIVLVSLLIIIIIGFIIWQKKNKK